jgi:DNA-binding response OmpR family regulator
MTSDRPMVLFVTRDDSSLATQVQVFREAGYPVHTAASTDEARSALKGSLFRLIILDHSLSQAERLALVKFTRQLAPRTFVLVLHASGRDCGADLVLDSRLGDQTVLQQVSHLFES